MNLLGVAEASKHLGRRCVEKAEQLIRFQSIRSLVHLFEGKNNLMLQQHL